MSYLLSRMSSIRRFVSNNLPSAKPELWGNLPNVVWRRVSARINTKFHPDWPNRPAIVPLEPGGLMLEVIPGEVVGAPIASFGVFEFAVTQLLRSYLAPGDVFVDVGANIGYYSVIAGGVVGSAGRVFAFEPSPRIRARLARNIALNQMTRFIEVRSEAAFDQAGTVRLIEPTGSGNDGLAYVNMQEDGYGLEVAAVRLDALAELQNPIPTLLKVDVEGGEANVFRGAAGLLADSQGPSILFESFEIARDSAILRAYGYEVLQPRLSGGSVRLLRDLNAPPYRLWEAPNFLAVKNERGRRFVAALALT